MIRRVAARLARAVGLALLLLVGPARTLRAQAVPEGFEQGIFELRIGRGVAETVPGLLAPSGAVLVPLDRVLALTGVPTSRTDAAITVQRARAAGSATLELTARRLVEPSGATALATEDLVLAEHVHYISSARVAQLLGARVEVDLGQLSVFLSRTPPFPVEQAALRAQRTSRGIGRSGVATEALQVPFVPRSGGAVLDWTVTSLATARTVGTSTGALRGAAALAGGDVVGGFGLTADATTGVRASSSEWSYRRGLPGNRWLRQFQMGDIIGGGAQLRSLRGLTVTNAHTIGDMLFGAVPVNVSLPQGWQYEVYQDGQLLGFSDAGSPGPVYVPLRYGTTPVQVRLVSPTGDETVRDYSYLIPQTQQQPGRLEYTAGGGRCSFGCTSTAFADASYGVVPWLTVTGGGERRTTDSLARTIPHGGVSVLTYSGWNAQLQAARESFTRASLVYGGSGRLLGSGSYSRTHAGADQPSVVAGSQFGRWLFDGQLQLRSGAAGRVGGWRLENTLEGAAGGSTERSRTALTAQLLRGSTTLSYESERASARRQAGVSVLSVLPARLHVSSLLGTVLFDRHAVRAVEVSTALQTGRRGAAGVTMRWEAGTGVIVTAGYNGALDVLRLTSRLSASRDRPAYVATAASGSLALEGRRPSAFEGPGVGLAGVAGRVFYDVNGNGVYDAGDEAAAQVRLVVNGAQTRSDSAGRYRSWSATPYEISDVAIDTLAFTDFSWTLLRGRTLVRATPGMFNEVDFPLVRTRELAGEVVPDSAVATAGGVTLLLTSVDGGTSQKIVTFSDGTFYVSRVLPGRYRLTVSPSALEALGAEASPAALPVEVTFEAGDAVLSLPPLRLVRRAGAEGAKSDHD